MRKSLFTEEQVVAILKESEAGTPTQDLVRRHGISGNTSLFVAKEVRRDGCQRRKASEAARGVSLPTPGLSDQFDHLIFNQLQCRGSDSATNLRQESIPDVFPQVDHLPSNCLRPAPRETGTAGLTRPLRLRMLLHRALLLAGEASPTPFLPRGWAPV